jgi:hypothetical protein
LLTLSKFPLHATTWANVIRVDIWYWYDAHPASHNGYNRQNYNPWQATCHSILSVNSNNKCKVSFVDIIGWFSFCLLTHFVCDLWQVSGFPVSSINKTYCHDRTEILLKVHRICIFFSSSKTMLLKNSISNKNEQQQNIDIKFSAHNAFLE